MNIHADKIVITYNFTEQPPIKGKHFDNAENIEKQALNPAFSLNLGSHKRENSPPTKRHPQRVFFRCATCEIRRAEVM